MYITQIQRTYGWETHYISFLYVSTLTLTWNVVMSKKMVYIHSLQSPPLPPDGNKGACQKVIFVRWSIKGFTMALLVQACCPCIVMKSTLFHMLKGPSVDNNLMTIVDSNTCFAACICCILITMFDLAKTEREGLLWDAVTSSRE